MVSSSESRHSYVRRYASIDAGLSLQWSEDKPRPPIVTRWYWYWVEQVRMMTASSRSKAYPNYRVCNDRVSGRRVSCVFPFASGDVVFFEWINVSTRSVRHSRT